MTYIHGTFKDYYDNDIEVEFRSDNGDEEILIGDTDGADIFFSGDEPVVISFDASDLFNTIIMKKCSINLVSKIYLGNKIFAGNSEDIRVKVFKNNVLIFSGFVEPCSYTQPWSHQYESFTVQCTDYLGTLKYKYLTDYDSYENLVADANIYTFKQYINRLMLNNFGSVMYDGSKKIGDVSAFDLCGVSLNVFLGDGEDKTFSFENILKEILQYLNLHIIQEGENFYIFDWKTVQNNSATWEALYGTLNSLTLSDIQITQSMYSSDETNISMSDIYNQVQVKCDLQNIDEIVSSPLDSDMIDWKYPSRQMFMTEYWALFDPNEPANWDKYPNSVKAFTGLVTSSMTEIYNSIDPSTAINYDNWYARDWYVKMLYNPKWTLSYKNQNIEELMDKSGNNYINQHKIMKLLRQERFFPALVEISKLTDPLSPTNFKRSGKQSRDNYMVISINGNYDNSEAESTNIDTANQQASGNGLLTFSGDSGSFSPNSSDDTNYILFQGKLAFAPIIKNSGWGTWATRSSGAGGSQHPNPIITHRWVRVRDNSADNTFEDIKRAAVGYEPTPEIGPSSQTVYSNTTFQGIIDQIPDGNSVPYTDSSTCFYAKQFWTSEQSNGAPQPANNELFMYPFVDIKEYQQYPYSYSREGKLTSMYDKVPILECEMKIGDKYLVENTYDRNNKKPLYEWLTIDECPYLKDDNGSDTSVKKNTFTIGIDPNIGDPIIGKEYELASTIEGKLTDETGTAIPITYEDALTGPVSFKIKGIVNLTWDGVTVRNPELFEHTAWGLNYENILSQCSAIWIKDFNVRFIPGNKGIEAKNNEKDLVYISDEQDRYIKKKDDIEFKINTMPDVETTTSLGISSNVSYTNVINTSTNQAVSEITDGVNTDIAEKLYVDQYWNYYNSPKIIMDTDIHNNGYSIFNTFTVGGFGKMLTTGMTLNIKEDTVHITGRQC